MGHRPGRRLGTDGGGNGPGPGQGITGQVRIGYNGSTHMPYVDAGLKALEEHAPQIGCIVKRGEPPKLEQLLQEGELDGIFSNLPHVSRFDWMDYITVEPCGVTALLSAKHPLSGAQGLYLSQIAGEPYVDYERKMSPNAHDFIWEAFRRAGFTPNVAVCVQDVEEIAVMVAADPGALPSCRAPQPSPCAPMSYAPCRSWTAQQAMIWYSPGTGSA